MKKLKEMSLEELWQLFPIILKEHSPVYVEWYEEEKHNLEELFSEFEILVISHIGSTSVEGLIAKPIVDILLEFPAGYEHDCIRRSLGATSSDVIEPPESGKTEPLESEIESHL